MSRPLFVDARQMSAPPVRDAKYGITSEFDPAGRLDWIASRPRELPEAVVGPEAAARIDEIHVASIAIHRRRALHDTRIVRRLQPLHGIRDRTRTDAFPRLRGHRDDSGVGRHLPWRLEAGDADLLVEVRRAASRLGHEKRIEALPLAFADAQHGLSDEPPRIGHAVLVEDKVRRVFLAGHGMAVGSFRLARKRLEDNALHVTRISRLGIAQRGEHVPPGVSGEVVVGEVVYLRTPHAVHALVAERRQHRIDLCVIREVLRAFRGREPGKRSGLLHEHFATARLREIELPLMAEEPWIGTGFAKKPTD